jgi:hypothetical protein
LYIYSDSEPPTSDADTALETQPELQKPIAQKSVEEKAPDDSAEKSEEIKDSWDASDTEVKDAWDAESDAEGKDGSGK